MAKFATPVAMKVTEEQFNRDLQKPLEALGYINSSLLPIDDGYLVTQDCDNNSEIYSYCDRQFFDERHIIEEYNPELFLAIAAMTEGDIPIKGEWLYSNIVSKIFQVKNFGILNDCKSGQISLSDPTGSGHFHKPTVQQLEEHFKISANYEPILKQEIPEEFYVRYGEEFTEDFYEALREWAKQNSTGPEYDYYESYHKFKESSSLGFTGFNFSKTLHERMTYAYGLDNNRRQGVFETKYTLEQVKKLINYKSKTNKNEYKECSYERESREIKQIDGDLDSISSREGGKEIKIRTVSSRNLCQRGSIESSNSITSPRGSSSRLRAERGRLYI